MLHFLFRHGLGDCANFAHAIPLLRKAGCDVAVDCSPDKEPIFRAAGATIKPGASIKHPYPHAPDHPAGPSSQSWQGNKIAFGAFGFSLPSLGSVTEVWDAMIGQRLSMDSQIPVPAPQLLSGLLQGLPRPWILLHTRGNSTPKQVNFPESLERDTYFHLLNKTKGTVILLDWDNRVALYEHPRLIHLGRHLGKLDLPHLAALMNLADLMVGVDSGPLHFARLTNVPVLGVWFGHTPYTFCIPSRRAFHLVSGQHAAIDLTRRVPYNTELFDASVNLAELIAARACEMIAGPQFLDSYRIGQDMQLRHFVRLTGSQQLVNGVPADRSATFGAALRFLSLRADATMIETGCIRSAEDWSGAGFSTYLFGAFLKAHGGRLISFEANDRNIRFARIACAPLGNHVSFEQGDSATLLQSFKGTADLVYLDSADVGVPGYQEHCLAEARAAVRILDQAGRILIDDTPADGRQWKGKGALAVPWLLSNGWRVEANGYQVLLRPAATAP